MHTKFARRLFHTATVLALLLPLCSASAATGDTIIEEGMGTIEIVQEAAIDNAIGNWTLIRPDSSTISLNHQKNYINEESPSGNYTLVIENAEGASVFLEVLRNGDLIGSSSIPRATFALSKDDHYVLHAVYAFTITGKVSVNSQPAGIPFTLRGPARLLFEGITPASYEEVPRGLYSVQYHPPEGCTQPKAKSDTLEKESRISFTIQFSCDLLDAQMQEEWQRQLQYVTITVGTRTLPLLDVPIGEWFAPYVHTVAKTGIMSGYKDAAGEYTGTFGPNDAVSLAQLAKIAHEVSGIDEQERRGTPRNERARGTWFEQYYISAEQRFWEAFRDTRDDPARPATRAEVVATLLQALDVPRVWPKGTLFLDVQPTTPYAASIETAALDGLVDSTAESFRPNDPINRAEIAKMISIAIETYLPDSPEITGESQQ